MLNHKKDKRGDAPSGYGRWLWRGIGIEAPADWEMLLFSRRLDDGTCTFADRYHYRMQVAWRLLEGEPDLARTMRDYAGKLRHEEERAAVETCDTAGWFGVGYDDGNGGRSYRFARFFTEQSLMLEVVFPPADGEPPPMEDILRRMTAGGDLRRWCGLGMDVGIPAGLRMAACEARPGAASMRFVPESAKDDDGVDEFYFVRLGMLKRWLTGSPRDWLKLQLPTGADIEESGVIGQSGHEGAWFSGRLPRRSWLRGLFSPPGRFAATVWICPGDGRLYMRMRKCRSKDKIADADLIGGGLWCCAEAAKTAPPAGL